MQVERGHQSRDGILRDFCDGRVFKSHPLFSVVVNSLQMLLYYDDVEICNPLGSSRIKHKQGIYLYMYLDMILF